MIADVEPEHVALGGQQHRLLPLAEWHSQCESHAGGGLGLGVGEQVELANRLGALSFDHGVDGVGVHRDQTSTSVAQRVEGASLDQRLDHPLIAHADLDLGQEVGEVDIASLGGPGGNERLDHPLAHVAHGRQPEPDVGAHRGEVGLGLVDVGREHLDSHATALSEVDRRLVLIVFGAGEQGRHVLSRVVGLEVGGPVRHQPVTGGVGLVEGVVGEGDQYLPQRLD
ncbi:unannotated protein [freshwater metagenome]|uniref:Unannotated protein n=1 Tax=freshwater metagenome TaxID=449393 RepID=A0A6J7QLX0_9ZZZZ